MKLAIKKATVDVSVYVFIQNSSLTTGAGLTGLVFNSASLVCYYVRPLAAAAALTLATQTVTGAHSDGGFVEVDATNMPGVYRLDLSDAICATGVNSVVVMLKGATNMAPVLLEIQLVSYDPNDAVRFGLTALPNAAADAAGGLPISDAGGLDLDARLDAAITSRLAPTTAGRTLDVTATGAAGIDWGNVENPTTAVNLSATNIDTDQVVASVSGAVGSVTGAVGSVTGNVGGNVTGSVGSLATQAKADVNAEVDTALVDVRLDELLAADSDIDGAAPPTVGSVFHELMTKTAGSFTYDQTTDSLEAVRDRGDAAWITATGFSTLDAAGVRAAVGLASANLDTQLDALPTAAEVATAVGAPSAASIADAVWDEDATAHQTQGTFGQAIGDPGADTDTIFGLVNTNLNATVGSRAIAGDAMALTSGERNSTADAILARTLGTESYAADGAVPTLAQALFMILSGTLEFSISGTTLTCKKLDGSTTAMTFTLDSATTPTSRTRAT